MWKGRLKRSHEVNNKAACGLHGGSRRSRRTPCGYGYSARVAATRVSAPFGRLSNRRHESESLTEGAEIVYTMPSPSCVGPEGDGA